MKNNYPLLRNTHLRFFFFCVLLTALNSYTSTAQEWKKGKHQPNVLYATPKETKDHDTTGLDKVRVGIGTASPQSNLHVMGNTILQGTTAVKGTLNADTANANLLTADSLKTNALNVEGNARIKGFLTVDSMRVPGGLHIGNNSLVLNGDIVDIDNLNIHHDELLCSSGILSIGGFPTNSYIKVGIGTQDPQAKLHLFHGNGNPLNPGDVFCLFTNGETNFNTTNGFQIGIASNGNAVLNQRQNLHMLFKTDTTERMRIRNNGNIGIGDTTANSKLTINSDTAGISGLQFTNLISTSPRSTANGGVLSVDATGKVILVADANSGTTGTGTGDVKGCTGTTADNNYLTKWTDATNKTICNSLVYDNGTNVGIGTTSPSSELDIESSTGATEIEITGKGSDFANAAIALKATSGINYSATGIFMHDTLGGNEWFAGRPYGFNASNRFVIQYNSANASHNTKTAGLKDGGNNLTGTQRFFTVESNGTVGIGTGAASPQALFHVAADKNSTYDSSFVVTTAGRVGIGTSSPGYKLDVNGTARVTGKMGIGIDIAPSTAPNTVLNINGNLNANGGSFISDHIFKTNIDSIHSALNTIKQLKPKSFYFDTTNVYGLNFSNSKQYGFIAQDVESILPELISSTSKPADVDSLGTVIHPALTYKGVNYNAFFGILTKGIQEQSFEIDSLKSVLNGLLTKTNKQDSINAALQNQLTQLLNCCNNEKGSSQSHSNNAQEHYKTEGSEQITNKQVVELSVANQLYLGQNRPNPFTNKTEIDYYIPSDISNAQLKIYDNLGKELKTLVLMQGYNTIELNIGNLAGGAYTYCLVVNGSVVDKKTMLYLKQ